MMQPGVVEQRGGAGHASLSVGVEQATHERLRTRIHLRPVLAREAVVALNDIRRCLLHGLIQEWR